MKRFTTPRGWGAVRRLAAVLATVILLTSAAMSPARAATGMTWQVAVGEESPDMAIQGMAFLPGTITINAGDTVNWYANSAEIHTVTFNPPNPDFTAPATTESTISSPGDYRNSGLITTDPADVASFGFHAVLNYQLTFTAPGTYHYICVVHGQAMMGTVIVNPEDTPYPHTAQYYASQVNKGTAEVKAAGQRLWSTARSTSDNHHVYVGAADMTAMVMRFTKPQVTIRVNESVTFDLSLNGVAVPHTVTFGEEPANPFAPTGDPDQIMLDSNVSSGVLLPPQTFTATFREPGTYHYICALHDGMGMVGTVVVLP